MRTSLMPRLLLAAVAVVLVLPWLVEFYTDWLWLGETGYQQLFLTEVTVRSWMALIVFLLAFVVLFWNIRAAIRWLLRPNMVLSIGFWPARIVLSRRELGLGALVASVAIALILAAYTANHWFVWLRFRHAVPFGRPDPLLGHDAGFYVFTLPFLALLKTLVLASFACALAAVLVIYVFGGALRFDPRVGLTVDRRALAHVSLIGAGLFLGVAFGAYLAVPELLLSPSGLIHGATYTDVHARWPAWRLLAVVAAGGAILTAGNAWLQKVWPLVASVALTLLVWIGGGIYAAAIQRFLVAPNEQVREEPFIVHNVAATREAYGLDDVEERWISGDAVLTRRDIEHNADTLANVRLWDHGPLLDTFGQIQEIRTYYDFVSVDNDRYRIGGKMRQIMLSARELNAASLPNPTWLVERLNFTHGYGVALGPVNQVTPEGLPVLFIKNMPPESTVDLTVKQPAVYFGELSSDYVFVRSRAREFHYPRGEDNEYTQYEGTGGVPAGSFLRKLLFAIRFRSLNILLSRDLGPETRVLFHRNIRDRLRTIAEDPILRYDHDPYLVIADGRLVWMIDAYTWSSRYPYSTPVAGGLNYIRNSVKVTLDAYDGTTRYYLADPEDPLARTLERIFPGFLRPLDEMPPALREHIRYPEGLFAIQANVFASYHMTNPAVFYNKEDQWEIPTIESGQNPQPMEPYYAMMRLPGEPAAEFIQMLPFTPRRKDNLAAWMVARSDGEHYGKLLVFQFPKQKLVFGPRQIVARINQDQVISPQITLWNQQGSEVIQGTLLVIPIEESLIYIRPLYLRSAGGKIPELKRVIVAHQNQIVMEETLERAIDRLFGDGRPREAAPAAEAPAPVPAAEEAPGPARPTPGPDLAELAAQARMHFERALAAQRNGDWALYGEEIKRLGEVLEKMKGR